MVYASLIVLFLERFLNKNCLLQKICLVIDTLYTIITRQNKQPLSLLIEYNFFLQLTIHVESVLYDPNVKH